MFVWYNSTYVENGSNRFLTKIKCETILLETANFNEIKEWSFKKLIGTSGCTRVSEKSNQS